MCTGLDNILYEINDALLGQLRRMMNDLENMEMKIGDLISQKSSVAFKPLRDNLQYLRSELRQYTLEQKKLLLDILPRIKKGDGAEDELATLLSDWKASQFYDRTLDSFIRSRTREVNAIGFLMDYYDIEANNMELADYEKANDVQYIFQRSKVVVMDLNLLTPRSIIDAYLNNSEVDEEGFWFGNSSMQAEVGSQIRSLKEFGRANIDQDDKGYLLKVSG